MLKKYFLAGLLCFLLLISSAHPSIKVASDSTSKLESTTELINSTPVFESSPDTEVNNNSFYSYKIKVSDSDFDDVAIAATTKPSWLSLKYNTGGITSLVAGQGSGITEITAFNNIYDFTFDTDGNIYAVDYGANQIIKIDTDGSSSVFAGSGNAGYVDETGINAEFQYPNDIAIDSQGNLFVSEGESRVIRKVTPGGVVTTFAGNGDYGDVDAQGGNARFGRPSGIVIDANDNIYVIDRDYHKIKKIDNAGNVTTIAGSGSYGASDGAALSASFAGLYDIALDENEDLIIADSDNHAIRKLDVDNATVTTLAGGSSGYQDGVLANAKFHSPRSVAVGLRGEIYVADNNNNRIRIIEDGNVATYLGTGNYDYTEGQGVNAGVSIPISVEVNAEGLLFFIDNNTRLRKASLPQYELSGNPSGQVGDHNIVLEANDGQGGTATQSFTITVTNNNPAFTSTPITEINNNLDYRYEVNWEDADFNPVTITAPTLPSWLDLSLDPGGQVSTLFNSSSVTGIVFNSSNGIAYDADGNLYTISDNRIIKITPEGEGSVLSGTGANGYVDGPGNLAIFNYPNDLVVDSNGNVFVNDQSNNVIRKVAPDGETSTFLNDNNISYSSNIWIDPEDNIYLASNNRIYLVTPSAEVTLIAGTGNTGSDNGAALSATFNEIQDVFIDELGIIYIADAGNDLIRKIDTQGTVSTIAGSVQGDVNGTALSARFDSPNSLVLDKSGNLYISDINNHKIKVLDKDGNISTFVGSTQGNTNGVGEDAQISNPQYLTLTANGQLAFVNGYSSEIKTISLPQYILSGDPSGQVGDHSVVLQADDGQGGLATQTFTIAVTNGEPVIVSDPVVDIVEGQEYSYVVVANDEDGNDLTITSSSIPEWLSIETQEIGKVSSVYSYDRGFTNGIIGGEADFLGILDMAVNESTGKIYLVESENHAIRVLDLSGIVSTFVGGELGYVDGSSSEAKFNNPTSIEIDAQGNLYVADQGNHAIRKITPEGVTTTLAGGTSGKVDGVLGQARFNQPGSILLYDANTLFVADVANFLIRKIDLITQTVSTTAGTGSQGFNDGKASIAQFNFLLDLARDSKGNLFISEGWSAETFKGRIRKLANGNVSTFAGSNDDFQGTYDDIDGKGSEARFFLPSKLAIDELDNIYVSDNWVGQIRRINSNQEVITLAGTAGERMGFGDLVDGKGSDANLVNPILLGFVNNELWFRDEGLGGNNGDEFKIRRIIPRSGFAYLEGSPASEDLGEHQVVLEASDGQGGTDQQSFTITVTGTPPSITSDSQVAFNENSTEVAYIITATDPNTITYNLGSVNDESLFTVDGSSGEVSFNSSPDYEDPQDGNADNGYLIEVLAGNGEGTSSLLVEILVQNVNDNDPVFNTSPVVRINDNETYTYPISVIDADGQIPLVEASTLPDWLVLTDNLDGTAILQGGATGQTGQHEVVLTADDQSGRVTIQSFTIDITDVTAPAFTSSNSVQVNENQGGVIYTAALNETNDFTLQLSGGADQSLFDFDPNRGELSFIETPDFENPSDEDANNSYLVEISAEDGSGNATTLNLTINVQDVDPEAILRVEGDLTIPATALGFTSEFSVVAHNDGQAELIISQISYPEGYSGPSAPINIAANSSALLGFVFSPLDPQEYSGDIIVNSNGGNAALSVSANGEIVTGTEDVQVSELVKVYPNPAKDLLEIDVSRLNRSRLQISLFDIKGNRIERVESVEDIIVLNVGEQPDGILMIQFRLEQKVFYKKVMIKK